MIREEILNLKSGKKLDCLIEEHIFNHKPDKQYGWFGWHPRACAEADSWQECELVPNYSNDLSLSFKLLDKFHFNIDNVGYGDKKFCVRIRVYSENKESEIVELFGDNLPETICKVVLLGVLNL